MRKRFIFLPTTEFNPVFSGPGRGNLVVRCPECHEDVTAGFYIETRSTPARAAELDYMECPRCFIRLYVATGMMWSVEADAELERSNIESARLTTRIATWAWWTDTRSVKERGRVRDAVTKKLRDLGLEKNTLAQLIVSSHLKPHAANDGHFQRPEIYTMRDIDQLEILPAVVAEVEALSTNKTPHQTVIATWETMRG